MMQRILIVEDNPVNLFVALKQLAALGYEGLAVSSGGDAVEAVKQEIFGVILMDCGLPDMDGYETTRMIRDVERDRRSERSPIVAVTVETDDAAVQRCFAAGMDAHLAKPSGIAELRAMLARFVPAN